MNQIEKTTSDADTATLVGEQNKQEPDDSVKTKNVAEERVILDENTTQDIQYQSETLDSSISSKFNCEICPASFTSEKSVLKHLKIHTDEKLYECSICKAEFYRRAQVEKHLTLEHNVSHVVCEICSKGFNTKSQAIDHLKIHKVYCKDNKFFLSDGTQVTKSIESTFKDEPQEEYSDKSKELQRSELNPTKAIENKEFKSSKASPNKLADFKTAISGGTSLKRKTEEQNHDKNKIQISVASRKIKKIVKSSSSSNVKKLSLPKETKSVENKSPLKEVASRTVKSEGSRTRSHSSLNNKLISKSVEVVNNKTKGKAEKKNMLPEKDTKSELLCNVCSKKFTSQKYLNQHLKIHVTPKSVLKLPESSKLKTKANGVNIQNKNLSQEKKFKCNFCQNSFTNKVELQNHTISHKSTKARTVNRDKVGNASKMPYSCKKCEREFTTEYNLKRHYQTEGHKRNV